MHHRCIRLLISVRDGVDAYLAAKQPIIWPQSRNELAGLMGLMPQTAAFSYRATAQFQRAAGLSEQQISGLHVGSRLLRNAPAALQEVLKGGEGDVGVRKMREGWVGNDDE